MAIIKNKLKIDSSWSLDSFTHDEDKTVYLSDGRFNIELSPEIAVDIITFLVQEFEMKTNDKN